MAASITGSRRSCRRQVIPILEILLFAVLAAAPIMLADYLTVFVTRVLILALLALSFDLVWGYAGIMSFGQALFFGAAGYSVALLARDLGVTSSFIVLPAALAIGLVLSLGVGVFPCSGATRRPRSLSPWAPLLAPTWPTDWHEAGIISAGRMASPRSRR